RGGVGLAARGRERRRFVVLSGARTPFTPRMLLHGERSGAAFGRAYRALRAAAKPRPTRLRTNRLLATRRDGSFLCASRQERRSLCRSFRLIGPLRSMTPIRGFGQRMGLERGEFRLNS